MPNPQNFDHLLIFVNTVDYPIRSVDYLADIFDLKFRHYASEQWEITQLP